MNRAAPAAALVLAGCLTCGPGTAEKDGECVVTGGADTGGADTGGESGTVDSDTGDTGTVDSDTSDTGTVDSDTSDTGTVDSDTADTAPPADDGWPAQFFAPYVDATGYPTVRIGEIPAENGVYHYTLGFVVAQGAGDCTATWGTYYSIADGPSAWADDAKYTLYDQIAQLRASGGDVMVSFGGAANTPIEAACGDVASVVAEYTRVIETLALTRIDFDIEGSWVADRASISRRSEAIAALQAERAAAGAVLHVWYTLPVLPDGLTSDGVAVVQDAIDHGVVLDGVNVMTMDYGDGAAPDPDGRMGDYGIAAITALHDQLDALYSGTRSDAELWGMVGSTPMIGQNDVQSEVFTVADAESTRAFADGHGVGMLGMWSINRDHPCPKPTEWAQSTCNGLVDTPDWAFSVALGR